MGGSRRRSTTTGTTTSAPAATTNDAYRQPTDPASEAMSGRNTRPPAAWAAVSTPDTSPRRRTNQRPVTVATKASAIDPVPTPTSTPQRRTSCQAAVMKTVSPLPAATSRSATVTTRRIPNRSISAAAKGETSP